MPRRTLENEFSEWILSFCFVFLCSSIYNSSAAPLSLLWLSSPPFKQSIYYSHDHTENSLAVAPATCKNPFFIYISHLILIWRVLRALNDLIAVTRETKNVSNVADKQWCSYKFHYADDCWHGWSPIRECKWKRWINLFFFYFFFSFIHVISEFDFVANLLSCIRIYTKRLRSPLSDNSNRIFCETYVHKFKILVVVAAGVRLRIQFQFPAHYVLFPQKTKPTPRILLVSFSHFSIYRYFIPLWDWMRQYKPSERQQYNNIQRQTTKQITPSTKYQKLVHERDQLCETETACILSTWTWAMHFSLSHVNVYLYSGFSSFYFFTSFFRCFVEERTTKPNSVLKQRQQLL